MYNQNMNTNEKIKNRKKNKIWLMLSIILTIVSAMLIVVFESTVDRSAIPMEEKIGIASIDDVECEYNSYDNEWETYIEFEIKNVSDELLLVTLYVNVETPSGNEVQTIKMDPKVLEPESSYSGWVEFSSAKKFNHLNSIEASVNGGEKFVVQAVKEIPLTTGAMVSSMAFIVGIIGIAIFSSKVKGKSTFIDDAVEETDEVAETVKAPTVAKEGNGPYMPEESEEIKSLKQEIEKEHLENALTEMRNKNAVKCAYCGTKNSAKNTICSNCGARLE